jgi:Mce-associated membrane protein
MTVKTTTDKRKDVFDEAVEEVENADTGEKGEDDATPEDAVVADESDDSDTSEETSAETSDTPRWRRRILFGSVATVFLAALAGCGFLGWQLWQNEQVLQAGNQARDAAVSYAQVLTSIDSNKVDENFDQVLAGATGEFKDMYSQSSMQLRQLLIDNKATAHGVVVESGVQSASKDKVVVLLFVDQSVQNTAVPDPRIDRSRIKMTMEKADGQWKASKVELP